LKNKLRENEVIKLWQQLLLNRRKLTTEGGEPIRIIYPGRSNDDQGADFREAVIASRRDVIKGDIEVHVKSSAWLAHRHHQNPVYNRVILNVVMWHNSKTPTTLQNGSEIPVLALHYYLTDTVSQETNSAPRTALDHSCFKTAYNWKRDLVAEILNHAGEERFLAKAKQFQFDIAQMGPKQSLYRGIMGALGYAKNKLPFLELARRLPLQTLESITRDIMPNEECLSRQQALLLGTAGLLPSQRSNRHRENRTADEWTEKLERLWVSGCHGQPMSENAWHLFKVRPNNFPVRRIIAMSCLILSYKEKGILREMVNIIRDTSPAKGHHRLVEGLMVTTNGYWANHFDFGLTSGAKTQSLLGRSRAADIAVNVLLPFTFAWGKFDTPSKFEQKSLDLYHHFPRLVDNIISRHMSIQLGLDNSLVNSARRQQGLIHIYNTLCRQGECHRCPVGTISG